MANSSISRAQSPTDVGNGMLKTRSNYSTPMDVEEKEAVAEVEEAVEEKTEDEKPEAGQSSNNL